jgi:hypothetical protein
MTTKVRMLAPMLGRVSGGCEGSNELVYHDLQRGDTVSLADELAHHYCEIGYATTDLTGELPRPFRHPMWFVP